MHLSTLSSNVTPVAILVGSICNSVNLFPDFSAILPGMAETPYQDNKT